MHLRSMIAAGWLLFTVQLSAQKTFNKTELAKGQTPAGFYGSMPLILEWPNEKNLAIRMKAHPDSAMKDYLMEVKSGKLSPYQKPPVVIPQEASVTIRNKDIYWRRGNDERRLTNDTTEEKNPTLSPDKTKVAYTKKNNLYCIDLSDGKEIQLTTDGTQTILNGYATWVYWEEIFGRPTRFRAFWWSPDSKTIAYMRFDENNIKMFPLYVADGTHGYIEETRYPKSGDPNPAVKLGFIQYQGGNTTWVDFGEETNHQLGWPKWMPSGDRLYVQWQNRGQDSLRIFAVNPSDGSKKEVYFETQKTWTDLSEADSRIEFINGGKDMLIQSDKSGWNHLYLYTADGTLKQQITSGEYRVTSIDFIDEKAAIIYFRARTKQRSAETNLFRVRMNGKDLKQITPDGENVGDVNLSPSCTFAAVTHSNLNRPNTVTLFDMNGNTIRTLGGMGDGGVKNYALAKTELIRIKSADGKFDLPAIVTWPKQMIADKKYPMLISIYGGPDAGTVYDRWQWSPLREFYATEDIIQVAFDHRASGHFGKEGVNYIHRNLGHWELEDYSTMAKWFIDKGYADPAKIAITGFSYGGYMTCLALTKGRDVFTHGMAGGSVVDWRLYDSHYTERFMDMPQENAEGYKISSVLNYADRYKGMLQIVHGTMDDNVHMQNSIQLIGALQDKGKDFEFMLYPNGRHGWRNMPARNNHFENLKTKFIYKYLLEKEVPRELLR